MASGMGMYVLAFDPFGKKSPQEIAATLPGATPVGSAAELFAWSKFVSLHCPATPQT